MYSMYWSVILLIFQHSQNSKKHFYHMSSACCVWLSLHVKCKTKMKVTHNFVFCVCYPFILQKLYLQFHMYFVFLCVLSICLTKANTFFLINFPHLIKGCKLQNLYSAYRLFSLLLYFQWMIHLIELWSILISSRSSNELAGNCCWLLAPNCFLL